MEELLVLLLKKKKGEDLLIDDELRFKNGDNDAVFKVEKIIK